jgi:peroxiredoxin 2/4
MIETQITGPTEPRSLRIGDTAPDFQARTTLGEMRLSDLRGRWLVFFSHPADFTPVCTSEFVGLARAADRFGAMDCGLLGLSVDSLYSHLAWVEAIERNFGVTIPFAIVEDPSMAIGRAYGMLDANAADSSGVRMTYFISPEGVIRATTSYPMDVGRSVDEMVRMVAALQRAAGDDVLTPEGWQPGDEVLLPPAQSQDAAALSGKGEQPWFYQTRADRP